MSVFSFVSPVTARRRVKAPVHLGRIGILIAISISAFVLTTIVGMSTAQAPPASPPPEVVSQQSTDTTQSQPKKAEAKSDAAMTRPR